MNKRIFNPALFLCFALILCPPGRSFARGGVIQGLHIPDSAHVQILTTADGSVNVGRLVEVSEHEVRFQTRFGNVTVQIREIEEIREVPASSVRNGQYWFPSPNTTRLYFAPTARMLGQGAGYFADYYLFFPSVTFGLTDHLTVGGGMSIFPGAGMDKQIFYFTPKVGLKADEDLHFAAGALLVKVPSGEDHPSSAGILYGVGTYGTPESSLTVGLGYGFVEGNVAEKPMLMIGGEHRLSRRAAFVMENWVFPGVDQPLISYGVRLFGEKVSVDLALFNTIGEGAIFPGVPYVDFVFNF